MHRCTEPHRSLYALRSLHVEIQIRIKLAAHKVTDCSKVPKYIKPNASQRQNYNDSVASLFASSPPRNSEFWKSVSGAICTAAKICLIVLSSVRVNVFAS